MIRAPHPQPRVPRSAARRIAEAEQLFEQFVLLTPVPRPRPFTKSFSSMAAYERWRRAQRNPWNR